MVTLTHPFLAHPPDIQFKPPTSRRSVPRRNGVESQVYAQRYRAEWLAKITEAGVRRRAEIYHQQFDVLVAWRQELHP